MLEFTCDCCISDFNAYFCIGTFSLYGVLVILTIIVMVYYKYMVTICGKTNRIIYKYLNKLLILQIANMLSRMGFLSMGI